MREVIVIRHAEVELQWKPICYGTMDIPLSESGIQASRQFADDWSRRPAPCCIVHSGLQRTGALAQMLAQHFPCVPLLVDSRLRERDYGNWQGRHWEAIYAEHPDLHDLIDKPHTYCPHGGETTTQMQARAVDSLKSLQRHPGVAEGPVLAISHSGPMAALAGFCLSLHSTQWQPWTVNYLECLSFEPIDSSAATVRVTRRAERG